MEQVKASRAGNLLQQTPWQAKTVLFVLVTLGIDVALSVWGFIQSITFCYAVGAYGNNYTGVWINAFTWVLTVQALALVFQPSLATSRPARFYAWAWYSLWMFGSALILLIGMHYKPLVSQYAWAFLWLPAIATIAAAVITHHRSQLGGAPDCRPRLDVEANSLGHRPPSCSKAAWRMCWGNFWVFCGWSSMFWLSFLGFFLALQAAWLVTDQQLYPPPGQLYQVDLQDGSGYEPHIHMLCKGPKSTGLSTFILEAGGGAPGIGYAGIADELAAAGRRVCWYDRLGYGWSEDAILYGTADQASVVLYNTLKAANEAGPFIVAGHSGGGQLGMMFGAFHPELVSGIALLDSYDDVAIALGYRGSEYVNATLPSGRKAFRPMFTYLNPQLMSLTDVLRAITPLAWARFITTSQDRNYPYTAQSNAMYGNNKEWHAQWVAIAMAVKGVADNSDVLSDLAYNQSSGSGWPLWQGTAWPSFDPKPVLLLPAEKTLQPGIPNGCNVFDLPTNRACQDRIAACSEKACVYPSLYVRYLQTLSSNISMHVMPGAHDFPTSSYKETAAQLLLKFASV